MSANKNDICNMALGHCGVTGTIQDVDTDSTPEAVHCRTYYETCRGVVLEAQEWAFAKRRVALQSLGTPPDEWGYRYMYPNNCRLALRIVNPSTRTPRLEEKFPFEIKDYADGYGRVIVTDQPDAILEYNHDVTDATLFSSTFAYAMSQFLALNISSPLRVDAKLKAEIRKDYALWLSEAGALSLREAQIDPEPHSEFYAVRN